MQEYNDITMMLCFSNGGKKKKWSFQNGEMMKGNEKEDREMQKGSLIFGGLEEMVKGMRFISWCLMFIGN